MGRPEQLTTALKDGKSPRAIAYGFGLSHATVVQYLQTAVGRGLLCRSDILFAIEDSIASVVETMLVKSGIRTLSQFKQRWREIESELPSTNRSDFRVIQDDALLYFRLREAPLADMYESLCRLETFMHAYIREELERGYGPRDWWQKGIPAKVRKDCVLAKEEDPEPQEDPYCYTTFMHLREIFDKRWGLFCQLLPKSVSSDKSRFLSELGRLNLIRNRIMHPVRRYRPTKQDFDFVKDFAARMFAEEEEEASSPEPPVPRPKIRPQP